MLLFLLISLLTFVVNVSGTCYPPNNEKIAHTEKCVCPAGKYQKLNVLTYTFVQKDSYGDGGSTIRVNDDQGDQIISYTMVAGSRKETAFEVEPGKNYSFILTVDSYPQEQSYEILNEDGVSFKSVDSVDSGDNKFSYRIDICYDCPAGTYSVNGVCTECASGLGSTAGSVGSSSCTECLAGQYVDGDCKSCAAGKYQNQTGQIACAECASGTSSFTGAIDCTCPAGMKLSLDLDMYVGNSEGEIWYYRNDGGSFTRQTGAANPFNGVDVGAYAAPYFVDDDNDGDMDAYVGNYKGEIWYYHNDGGSFEKTYANPFNGVDVGLEAKPSFVDDDNDGDMDAYVGNWEGKIWYYHNDGSSTSPSFTRHSSSMDGVDVGSYAAPYFVDDDNDGDFDAFIGNLDGEIWYYRNDGNSTSPSFTRHSSSLDGVDVGSGANPYFVDDDNDGDFDLYVGNSAGKIWYYRNDGSSTSPSFTLHSSSLDDINVGSYASPFLFYTEHVSCTECQSGKYQDQRNQTECSECASGSVSPAGSSSCTECLAGQYADGVCKSCPEGKYQNQNGQTECAECASGWGSPAGSSVSSSCTECLAGQYVDGVCKSCPEGKYQNQTGQTECAECTSGTNSVAGSTNSANCTCPVGEGIVVESVNYTFVQKDSWGDGGSTIIVKDDQDVEIMKSLMPTSGEEGERKETEFEVERGKTYSFILTVHSYPQEQSYEILNEDGDSVKSVDSVDSGDNEFSYTIGLCTECPSGTYSVNRVCTECPSGFISPAGSSSCTLTP